MELIIREPEGGFITLAEIELNEDFEEVPVKVARPILDFINRHNGELVDGYDLDEIAVSLEERLKDAGLVNR